MIIKNYIKAKELNTITKKLKSEMKNVRSKCNESTTNPTKRNVYKSKGLFTDIECLHELTTKIAKELNNQTFISKHYSKYMINKMGAKIQACRNLKNHINSFYHYQLTGMFCNKYNQGSQLESHVDDHNGISISLLLTDDQNGEGLTLHDSNGSFLLSGTRGDIIAFHSKELHEVKQLNHKRMALIMFFSYDIPSKHSSNDNISNIKINKLKGNSLKMHVKKNKLVKKKNVKKSANNEILFNCTKCHHVSKSKKLLWQHMNNHETELKFACTFPDCFWKFNTKNKLTQHTNNTHTGKIYQCLQCVCKYKQKSNLTKHIKRKH